MADDIGTALRTSARVETRVAALALLLWIGLGAFLWWGATFYRCGGGMCGLALLPVALLLGGGAFLASILAGGVACVVALRQGAALSAASLAFVTAAGLLAAYAPYYNGHPGHPIVTAIYGYSPGDFDLHPFALPGSIALVVTVPATALAHGLARRWVRRALATAGIIAVLGLLLAVRLSS